MPINIQNSVGTGGVNKPDDVSAVKERLIELGFDWLAAEGVIDQVDQLTIYTIKLFQTIKTGLNTITGDGRVDASAVAATARRWLLYLIGSTWAIFPWMTL